jgi:hypothetical protein
MGHLQRMGEIRNAQKVSKNLKGIYHSEELSVYGKIMEIWISGNKV